MKRFLPFALVAASLAHGDGRPEKPGPPDPGKITREAAAFKFAIGKRGGTLNDWIESDPRSFNYAVDTDRTLGSVLGGLVFECLFERDAVTLEWGPRLAAAVPAGSEDADGRVYVVALREDVVWHDGKPFGADDVVFTWNEIVLNEAFPCPYRTTVQLEVPDEAGKSVRRSVAIEKVDAKTVRFTFPRRHALWQSLVSAVPIFPKHLLKPRVDAGTLTAAWDLKTPPSEIAGTGPFRLAGFQPMDRIVLRRHDAWYRKDEAGNRLPYLDQIVFHHVEGGAGLTDAFMDRTIDYVEMQESAIDAVLLKATREDFQIVNMGPKAAWSYLAFNQNPRAAADGTPLVAPHKSKWFRDVRFRRAVAHTLDRDKIVDEVYGGQATPLWGPYPPKYRKYFTDDVAKYPRSLKKARALLEEMGLKEDSDGDGVREDADGHPVEFEVLAYRSGRTAEILDTLQESLARAGVRMKITWAQFNDILRRVTTDLNWEAVTLGYGAGAEPLLGKSIWKSTEARRVWNPRGLPADERDWERRLDALFEEAYSSWDPDARRFRPERDVELAHEWQKLCAENLPHIYLFAANQLYFVSNRLKNRRTSLHSLFDLDRVYVED
ncbi:MAG: hypothetical protein HYY18_08910 [Planctomycetes bacterium]|nr:hypothetical protein [Planctomycetota bacterium]